VTIRLDTHLRLGSVIHTYPTAAYLAGVSGASVPGPTQPVVVNSEGKLGTATAASDGRAAGRNAIGKLRVRNRREDKEIGKQSREIATLKREVAKLSRG
jgi:hypothetical protein